MEFNAANPIVRLCLQGMSLEEKGENEEASNLYTKAWDEATNDFEKFLAAHFVARHENDMHDKLKWLETALQFALKINNDTVNSALPNLYSNIATCYDSLNDPVKAKKNKDLSILTADNLPDKGPFYHGTKADLKAGDLLTAGNKSNYNPDIVMNHIYFTALVNGAGLAAALAKGEGTERIYIVEPTGSFENDPNVTDKKFPGNPTRSFRTKAPLKIVGEVKEWARVTPGEIQKWRDKLADSNGDIIN